MHHALRAMRYALCVMPYAAFLLVFFLLSGCATDSGSARKDSTEIPTVQEQSVQADQDDDKTKPDIEPAKDRSVDALAALEEKWGIRILGVRLTAADFLLDFRYRLLDADKAKSLLSRQIKPHLIDQATGKKFEVPTTKLGPMRQTAVKPQANRNYIIIFANRDKVVQRGSKVTVVVGEFVVENLVVE